MKELIGESEREKLTKLFNFAKSKPYNYGQMLEMSQGFDPNDHKTRNQKGLKRIGLEFTINLSGSVVVTYTHEMHYDTLCHHLSVSMNQGRILPDVTVVNKIMKILNFRNDLHGCAVYKEKFGPDQTAINIIEPYKE